MATGPGKYDDLCTHVRETAQAQGAIIIVFGGTNGSGFSCQGSWETTKLMIATLEDVIGQMKRDTAS